jgi:hypothetical protein
MLEDFVITKLMSFTSGLRKMLRYGARNAGGFLSVIILSNVLVEETTNGRK